MDERDEPIAHGARPADDGDEEQHELFDLADDEIEVVESDDDDEDDFDLGARKRLDADFLLDKVIPGDVDWRGLVRRHPLVAVGVAAGLGLVIGRSKGPAIVAGISAAMTSTVMHQLSDVFDGDVFEF